MIKNILKTLKINHYIKNVVVVVPLLFSMNFCNLSLWLKCIIIFLAFCLVSSAVYIFNDLIDKKSDKLHPIKCKRPIASGEIPKKLAIFLLVILFIGSFALSATLNKLCILMILFYFTLNILYSL